MLFRSQILIDSGKTFSIETNGSHRTRAWWDKISEMEWLKNKTSWIFSIDGLKDTNHIYRKNSDWDSIMYGIEKLSKAKNKPFMTWKYIIFPYNKHQTRDAKNLSLDLGFDEFKPVESLRNYDSLSYDDRMLYDLEFYHANTSEMFKQNI